MKGRDIRRNQVVELLADHILTAGIQGASLRPLAAAAGTSDRMLLYYFADKDELLTATLSVIAQRLLCLLDSALPAAQPYPIILPLISELMASPLIAPYMRLWLELVSFASRNEGPIQVIAAQLCDGFLQWTASRLEVDREADRMPTAALLLATVEGLVLLKGIGRDSTASAALHGASLMNGDYQRKPAIKPTLSKRVVKSIDASPQPSQAVDKLPGKDEIR